MLSELNSANKVAGAKQVRRALNDGRAAKLFLAGEKEVPAEEVSTMKQLGAACSLAVGCAVAALLK